MQRGALLFMDPSLSGDGQRSCAGCHPGGSSDGAFWNAGLPAAAGEPEARRTPSLRGLWQSPPYLWDGSLATLDDVIERMLRVEMRGGRIGERDREALLQYLLSIPPFDNGRVDADGTPVEPAVLSVRRGAEVFANAECGECHRPPGFTREGVFDIGTGGSFSVPTLRNVSRQPALGHDGRWSDLETALGEKLRGLEIELTRPEQRQLLRYLELL